MIWLNGVVESTVEAIQARSAVPPVIVVFSDHGMRLDESDREEMFRNLLLASTPGRPDLYPQDASPVNLLARLANAYTATELPLSSEESYWLPTRSPTGLNLNNLKRTPMP